MSDFLGEIRRLEDSPDDGLWAPQILDHTNPKTLAGATYAAFDEIINGYTIQFTGTLTRVNLEGSNNNIVDVLISNGVTVVPSNSAGLQLVSVGSGLLPSEQQQLADIHENTERLRKSIFIDTTLVATGDGSQRTPFNNITDAVDAAEADDIRDLIVYSDIVIDRQLKNFRIHGVGTPTVDCNNQNLAGSEFLHCAMDGAYTGSITVQESLLKNNFWLNGYFERCGLAGDLFCVDGGNVLVTGCMSVIPGLGRPTISMNGAGTSQLSVRDNNGGLTIKDCNNALDKVTAEVNVGSLTFDSSCTNGEMVARGVCKFIDQTNGASVTDETIKPSEAREVHRGMYNKSWWDKNNNLLYIYDDDGVTPIAVFDTDATLTLKDPQ